MEARLATKEEILSFHDQSVIDKMQLLRETEGEGSETSTWEVAHLAVGACIDAVDKVGNTLLLL